jgi:signal recognition particle subunit SEC65
MLEGNLNELAKKLKKVEEEISKNKENYLPKFGSNDNSIIITAIEENNEKKMKKMEKKMKKYFANRFEEI